MPCAIILLLLGLPRLAIILMVLVGDYIGRAYDTALFPLLGFFFMPYTTIAYAWSMNTFDSVRGLGLVMVILAVLIDIGVIGGGARARQQAE